MYDGEKLVKRDSFASRLITRRLRYVMRSRKIVTADSTIRATFPFAMPKSIPNSASLNVPNRLRSTTLGFQLLLRSSFPRRDKLVEAVHFDACVLPSIETVYVSLVFRLKRCRDILTRVVTKVTY